MKAVKQSNAAATKVKKAAVANAPAFHALEELEDRRLMTYWPDFVGMNQVFAQFPWLRGGSNGVAVIDRGIDYMHPLLGANPATNAPSPRIVNVYDWNDNDTDPMPQNPPDGPNPLSAHATGVAGVLAMVAYKDPKDGKTYQGILQTSKLYNLRTSYTDSQGSITKAMQWVLDNHARYGITAINLTDFVGTSADVPLYNAQVKALWEAGVFIATPVANNWLGDPETGTPAHTTIGYPGKSPYIFATGGLTDDGKGVRPETQRGAGLDMIAPAMNVHIPYYDPSTGQHTWTPYGTGNSWGTPMVVGTAVLLQQIDPTISPAEIMKILQDSGVWVADTADNAAITGIPGYKRLDMLSAVKMAYTVRDDSLDQGAGNDTLATATSIPFDSTGKGSLTGLKILAHDHDYYKFTVSADGKFNLSATAGAQLLDANGNVIATLGSSGLPNQALSAGTYFIHAYSDTMGLGASYSVSVQSVNQPPTPPPAVVVGTHGTFNDMKYDAGGNLHFVWYDASDKTLKYSARDTTGTWAAVTTIDGAPDVGNFVSLALDSAGKPAVAYYDATNADLKYARFNGSSWDTQTVESTKKVGYYPSLQFTKTDQPVIAYYYKTGGDLKVATNTGSGWQATTVDSTDDVGRYPSLAINPSTGAWAVAYEATGIGAFKYAQKNGSTWSTTVVDKNGSGGGFVSLAFDSGNLPAFSYYDATNGDLKLARYNGSTWSKTAVATRNNTGMYTNLFFDGATPVIYYYNKTADTLNRVAVNGTVFSAQTLITAGGREDRVARTADGAETYSYFDSATGDLNVTDLLG